MIPVEIDFARNPDKEMGDTNKVLDNFNVLEHILDKATKEIKEITGLEITYFKVSVK